MVRASAGIAAGPERIFELIADLAQQPRWEGYDNLASAPAGQCVRRAGEVFTMTPARDGAIRENRVAQRARATTAGKLRASVDRLAALAEAP